MAMRLVLDSSTITSAVFRPGNRFVVRMEGANTINVESKRVDGTVWNAEGTLTTADKSLPLFATTGLEFRVVANAAGSEVYYELLPEME